MTLLIDDAKLWWRHATTWVSLFGIGALTTWNMMPEATHRVIPGWADALIGTALWGAVMIARFWPQPKLEQAKANA
jgi:hypothetical protein